ncbi:MAG: biopolymer transporter ExbD [Prevotella sp.]|nr:biopolymer transporter ExbD [Prevotella sp.]
MFNRRHRRSVPQLNTASVADISFMLLILFLVVTSMDIDKGLTRQLPPVTDNEMVRPKDVSKRNVLQVTIDNDNRVKVNGVFVNMNQLHERLLQFIDNPLNSDSLPEKRQRDIPLLGECNITDRHVIQLEAARNSSYDVYFQVQNSIVGAYRQLRDGLASKRFHCSYAQCSEDQKMALREFYPQRVSEIYAGKEEQP